MREYEKERDAALAAFDKDIVKVSDANDLPDDDLMELLRMWFVRGWILSKIDERNMPSVH